MSWLEEQPPTAELVTGSALEALTRGEVDIQIATAKRYPRALREIRGRIRQLALLDRETAEGCYYRLPKRGDDGKPIEGPSVRLAEIVASCWGNVRASARVIEVGDRAVVAQGVVIDLETNVAISVETRRRITNRHGKRYGDDMINVTANAACSIAFREAVFKVVPRALIKPIYEECRAFAVHQEQQERDQQRQGNRRPGAVDSRREALDAFAQLGADEASVFRMIGVRGFDDLTAEHVTDLRALYKAVKAGEVDLSEVLSGVVREAPADDPGSALGDFYDELEEREEAEPRG